MIPTPIKSWLNFWRAIFVTVFLIIPVMCLIIPIGIIWLFSLGFINFIPWFMNDNDGLLEKAASLLP